MRQVRSFLRASHLVLCQEAHVTLPRENDWTWSYREEADLFTSLLADVSKQTTIAGIAMFVGRDFRPGFRCAELLHIINGYACVLQLQGDQGALQIINAYGDPNSELDRIRLWNILTHDSRLWGARQGSN